MVSAAISLFLSISRWCVIDGDPHQGDGTARIFKDDQAVFTFSMHQRSVFPHSLYSSSLDVALDDGTGNEEYLAALSSALGQVIAISRPR